MSEKSRYLLNLEPENQVFRTPVVIKIVLTCQEHLIQSLLGQKVEVCYIRIKEVPVIEMICLFCRIILYPKDSHFYITENWLFPKYLKYIKNRWSYNSNKIFFEENCKRTYTLLAFKNFKCNLWSTLLICI